MNLENKKPSANKIEIPKQEFVTKILKDLTELGGVNYRGFNLVEVLRLRLEGKLTLQATADMLGFSNRERVRQREVLGLRVLLFSKRITQKEYDELKDFLSRWHLINFKP